MCVCVCVGVCVAFTIRGRWTLGGVAFENCVVVVFGRSMQSCSDVHNADLGSVDVLFMLVLQDAFCKASEM
jgi:hypothetical protein